MFNTSNPAQKPVIFLSEALDFFRGFADYSNITGCTTPLEVSDVDTHTHTHTTPITSLPRQHAVGAGQQRQSID